MAPNLYVCNLESNDKQAVISELLQALNDAGFVKNSTLALNDLLVREKQFSTGMEAGLAIPHAKSASVEDVVIAFGLHRKGIDFQSLDGQPTHFLFMVLSPPTMSGAHIQAMAYIARSMKDPVFQNKIRTCKSADEIKNLFSQ